MQQIDDIIIPELNPSAAVTDRARIGNNPIGQEWFNKVSNRNANEAANILTLLQGKDSIDAVKRSMLEKQFILPAKSPELFHFPNPKKFHVIPKLTILPQRRM